MIHQLRIDQRRKGSFARRRMSHRRPIPIALLLAAAIVASAQEADVALEQEGPHAGRTTRSVAAIESLDLTGVWAVMMARPGQMPAVAAYIWFYPDGTTVLRDSGTCGILERGEWEYEHTILTITSSKDEAESTVTVIGAPEPDREWGQRIVFDAGGFWEFVDSDPEMEC